MSTASLRELRGVLLEIHRELLHGQRMNVERLYGRMSAGELLQASIDDPRFDWLRPLSELVSDIDALLADAERRDDQGARQALVDRTRALLAPPDGESAFGRRYLRALQEEPAVGVAHGRLAGALD